MTVVKPGFEDLEHAIGLGLFGYAVIDSRLILREKRGAVAGWLPEIGARCADAGLLYGMEPALRDLQSGAAPPLILPSVGLGEEAAGRVNISIVWNADTAHFVVVVAPDLGTEQMDRLLIQQRREKQVLMQQAAAAADRLKISATLYRDIVESSEDAVLRIAPDMRLTFVNGAATSLLDLDRQASLGRAVRDALPLPEAENPWRADMCAEGPASFEQPFRRADGGVRWLWWRVHWLAERGPLREFQAVGRDVTETRRLRAELERANEEAKFAALAEERLSIAHDLHDTFVNTLVTTLARLAMLRRAAPEGAMKRDLEQAEGEARVGLREAREAVGTIRTRRNGGEGPRAALIEATDALRAKINVTLDIDEDLGALTPAQTTAIVRVAREALRNVERHSGARNVVASLRRGGKVVTLEIADDGIGSDFHRAPVGHFGLVGMREQASFAGGEIEIGRAEAGGVRVRMTLPADALLNPAVSK